MAVKKREVFGKFCLQGASSRVGFLEKNIEEILTDHAFCEQKATSTAISLITIPFFFVN